METWKAHLIKSIEEMEKAREDGEIDQDRYEVLGEMIIELQDIIED